MRDQVSKRVSLLNQKSEGEILDLKEHLTKYVDKTIKDELDIYKSQ